MISKIKHDLLLSVNQPMNSAYLEFIGIHFILFGATAPQRARSSSFTRFLDHTHNDALQSVGLLWTRDQLVAQTSTWQHTTLTTDRHPCPRLAFEPTISEGKQPQTYALDSAATGTGFGIQWDIEIHDKNLRKPKFLFFSFNFTFTLTRSRIGDLDMIFITQFLKTMINYIEP